MTAPDRFQTLECAHDTREVRGPHLRAPNDGRRPNRRLPEPIGNTPPVELDSAYHRRQHEWASAA